MQLCCWRRKRDKSTEDAGSVNRTSEQGSEGNGVIVSEVASVSDQLNGAGVSSQPEQSTWLLQIPAGGEQSESEDNTGNPRNKCSLAPGHSLMDWIRLGNSGCDLAGNRGQPRPITLAELGRHNSRTDAWMAVHGKCYNVTRYMDFHPGGADELMRGVGRDATRLFDEVHAWVNYEQMLAKCYLGPLRTAGNFITASSGGSGGGGSKPAASSGLKVATSGAGASSISSKAPSVGGEFKLPLLSLAPASTHNSPTRRSALSFAANALTAVEKCASLPASPTEESPSSELGMAGDVEDGGARQPEIVPRFDWMQKSGELVLVFYTRALCNPGWMVQAEEEDGGAAAEAGEEEATARRITVRIFTQLGAIHLFAFQLAHAVRWPGTSRLSQDTGKIELTFRKSAAQLWTTFGLLDRRKEAAAEAADSPASGGVPFACTISWRYRLSPDSWALLVQAPARIVQHIPVGYHVRLAAPGLGAAERSYTPVPAACLPADGAQMAAAAIAGGRAMALLVKRYPAGKLSGYLTEKETQASAAGRMRCGLARGSLSLYRIRLHTRVAMLAAGSGVTPMLGVLEYLMERTSNRMESITLLYFNKQESDIWCRGHLEQLAQRDKRLHITHYLSEPHPITSSDWPAAQVGRIAAGHVAPLADKTGALYATYCFVCGPPAFNDECRRLLAAVGLGASKVHVFY